MENGFEEESNHQGGRIRAWSSLVAISTSYSPLVLATKSHLHMSTALCIASWEKANVQLLLFDKWTLKNSKTIAEFKWTIPNQLINLVLYEMIQKK